MHAGGVRVPSLVHWPGVVTPNTVIQSLTSSLDWLPTFASLTGYHLSTAGTIYDGWDLSAMLFTKAGQLADKGARDRYFYHTSEDPVASLVAVRLGPWKLHFVTKGSHCNDDFPDAQCYAPTVNHTAAGGILFNVERDMSEVLPLPHTSAEYKKWAPVLMSMAADYSKTYVTGASEMGKGSSPDRFPCCNPGCTPMPGCCKCGGEQ